MEIHGTDPTTDRGDDPWDDVSARFADLGRRVKSTYRKSVDDDGPSEDEINDAFATLAGAWDRIAESITVLLRDEETREDLKAAASSLAGALGSMLTRLGADFAAETPAGSQGEEE